jgi:hypothetical protein
MEVGRIVYKYTLTQYGVTIRKFSTNDAEFAARAIVKTSKIHGAVKVTRTVVR